MLEDAGKISFEIVIEAVNDFTIILGLHWERKRLDKFPIIVNLPIGQEIIRVGPLKKHHGLITSRRQVVKCEAEKRQPTLGMLHHNSLVRTAGLERLRENGKRGRRSGCMERRPDAAHCCFVVGKEKTKCQNTKYLYYILYCIYIV
jgi:hypothetical protein